MKNKKFLPLVILVGVVALLGILLAVLTLHREAETDTTLPLCDLAADDIDALSYAGNNVEVSLLKGSDGWLLADDPSLPLDQTKVQSLVEDYANLKAQRKLEGNERPVQGVHTVAAIHEAAEGIAESSHRNNTPK